MKKEPELLERITVDPRVMTGKPIIRGLRITVAQILAAMAAGISENEILEEYPELESEDIRAVLLYARQRIDEEKVFPLSGVK